MSQEQIKLDRRQLLEQGHLRTDDLYGALYVPSDASVKAAVLCEAMAIRDLEPQLVADEMLPRFASSISRV